METIDLPAWKKLYLFALIILIGCGENAPVVKNTYIPVPPRYDSVLLYNTNDTIHFALDADTYKEVRSFNLFSENGIDFISFYDRRSESINTYKFLDQELVQKISLKKAFNGGQLFKTSVYIRNFDSIFITNKAKLYLFDSSGNKKKSMSFVESPDNAWPVFENGNLPVISNGSLISIVRPNVNYKSLDDLNKWMIFCEFDLTAGKASLHYGLPDIYRHHLYGYQFLDYNFTFNNHGRFVLSFPADTLLYETDLAGYNKSYYAKSQYQQFDIDPVAKEDLKENAGMKAYVTRDSYGPVYFDPVKKYYLRLAKQKITEQEFITKSRKRKQTVLIFNEDFKIIGESEIPNDISLDSIFPGPGGYLYARVNVADDYALNFVRFEIRNSAVAPFAMTKR